MAKQISLFILAFHTRGGGSGFRNRHGSATHGLCEINTFWLFWESAGSRHNLTQLVSSGAGLSAYAEHCLDDGCVDRFRQDITAALYG